MPRKVATNRSEQIAKIVWLAAFVLPIVLASLLLAAKAVPPAHAGGGAVLLALEDELAEEEWSEAEEACLAAEEEFEAGEIGEAELEAICEEVEAEAEGSPAGGSSGSGECVLRSSRARALLDRRSGRLRLTVGYTAFRKSTATVQVHRGAARVGSWRRRLGRSGVLRVVKKLGPAKADRLARARRLTVTVRAAATPRRCANQGRQAVTAKRSGSRLVWAPRR